jgi:NTE family protein
VTSVTPAALVLAGGGRAGIAWELGFIRGLEMSAPELMRVIRNPETTYVGTSAGSIVATQLAFGTDLDELLRPELENAPLGRSITKGGPFHMVRLLTAMIGGRIGARTPEDGRRRIGAYAKGANTVPEGAWIENIGNRLTGNTWPRRRLLLTAVDVDSGELRVFDRDSGVDVVRAVAASCAVPGLYPPITIDGRRYMDGGMRSIANADLAEGRDPVLVLAPLRGRGGLGVVSRSEVEALGEARVKIVYADRESAHAFGRNPLDTTTRAASAAAGQRQGRQAGQEIVAFWR